MMLICNTRLSSMVAGLICLAFSSLPLFAQTSAHVAAKESTAGETYVQAVQTHGQLQIVTGGGREITVTQRPDQEGFDQVRISPDHRAVGWLGMYPQQLKNQDLIPGPLVIYSNGKTRTFGEESIPVWYWCFEAGGKYVAFEHEPLHFYHGKDYKLRDVATGRVIANYYRDPKATDTPPKWVTELESRR